MAMRGDEGFQCLGPHERSVARKHQGKFCAPKKALRHLDGVTCAILRLLQNCDGAERLDDRRNLFRLMTYDDNRFARFERFARANDMFHERAPTGFVQDFGKARL